MKSSCTCRGAILVVNLMTLKTFSTVAQQLSFYIHTHTVYIVNTSRFYTSMMVFYRKQSLKACVSALQGADYRNRCYRSFVSCSGKELLVIFPLERIPMTDLVMMKHQLPALGMQLCVERAWFSRPGSGSGSGSSSSVSSTYST